MGCNPSDVDRACRKLDEKEHIVCDQATECPHLDGEEVRGGEDLEL